MGLTVDRQRRAVVKSGHLFRTAAMMTDRESSAAYSVLRKSVCPGVRRDRTALIWYRRAATMTSVRCYLGLR